jgi:hypothetical protein
LGRFPSSSWSSHTLSWPSPPRGRAHQHNYRWWGCRATWDACGSGAAICHCAIHHVRLNLSARLISHGTIFFSQQNITSRLISRRNHPTNRVIVGTV